MHEQIIVTGGSGFFGSNLCRYLMAKYPDKLIVNYDKMTYSSNPVWMQNLEGKNYRFVSGDVNNKLWFRKVVEDRKTALILHLAGSTHVDKSFLYVEEFIENNILGTFSLLEVVRYLKNKPLFVYMSTDEIFGDAPHGTYYKEDDRYYPQNPYSASKASAEMYCRAYYECFNVPVIIARSMNMFGPYQHPEKLIAKIITKILSDKEFTLYKGESIRGWIYVKDSCEALDKIATEGKQGSVYHIPPITYESVPNVAKTILDITGKHHLFKGYEGRRIKDDFRYALSGEKMRNELKWQPKTSFKDGMINTIEWYSKERDFWEDKVRF